MREIILLSVMTCFAVSATHGVPLVIRFVAGYVVMQAETERQKKCDAVIQKAVDENIKNGLKYGLKTGPS